MGNITRRESLKLSGLALGGLAVGGALIGPGAGQAQTDSCTGACYPTDIATQTYTYFFENLKTITPWGMDAQGKITGTPLARDEMRITFLGSMFPPPRRAQQEMSIFVEVGWDATKQVPLDQFVFDCGSGVSANYQAMGIGFGRMDKIFLTHLHADHMSDLSHIYCFGPSADRKSPLYVWGPGPSGVPNPQPPPQLYDDGTQAFCRNLREAMRWHTESFSFETTSWVNWANYDNEAPTKASWGLPVDPIPVGDDPPYDGYALIPIELDWTKYGQKRGDNIAYHNRKTGVTITHFPVVHTRQGSIGYKLEWHGLSMIFTGDTRPETRSIDQASNGGKGVDVFIHEMALPPEVLAMKTLGLTQPGSGPQWDALVNNLANVESGSHTPQGAFGYLLSHIQPRPRLTVATHFPVADDTVACALHSVQAHFPDPDHPLIFGRDITWSFDLMVIRVFKNRILQRRAVVNDFGFSPTPKTYPTNAPKYAHPRDQIDTSTEIPATNPDGSVNYCENGY